LINKYVANIVNNCDIITAVQSWKISF